MRLKLGEHQAPPGLRRRVQDRRGEVPVPVGVVVLAAAGARRGEQARRGHVLVTRVVTPVVNDEPARAHGALFNFEFGHRLVSRVHHGVQRTVRGVVLGVEPLRVGRVELVLERGGVAHRQLHHAPVAR